MPEETKYTPTSSFKVKDSGNRVLITSQSIKNYQSKNAAKIFINKYREKHDADDELIKTAESPAKSTLTEGKDAEKEKPASPLEALFSSPHSVNSLEDLMKNLNSTEKETISKNKEELSGILSTFVIGIIAFFVFVVVSITLLTGSDFGSILPVIFWVIIIILFSAGKQKVRRNLTDSRK